MRITTAGPFALPQPTLDTRRRGVAGLGCSGDSLDCLTVTGVPLTTSDGTSPAVSIATPQGLNVVGPSFSLSAGSLVTDGTGQWFGIVAVGVLGMLVLRNLFDRPTPRRRRKK